MSIPIRIALVGMGKIAQDQHLPAIAGNSQLELVATVSRHGEATEGRPIFRDLDALAASGTTVDAVALCTPPQVRRSMAAYAIAAGWHVFLEKPPGATLAEVEALRIAADVAGVSLFTSWHSRYAEGVEPARAWLTGRTLHDVTVTWREDVRVWHPGQNWIWEAGGFGVFDPGINALSIVTRILPRDLFVESAELDVPVNRASPIAARVAMRDTSGLRVKMDLDFRQQGPQSWDIVVETNAGTLTLSKGGSVLHVDGTPLKAPADALHGEYPGLYARFVEIVRSGASDVDVSPLRLVADSFLCGHQNRVGPFDW